MADYGGVGGRSPFQGEDPIYRDPTPEELADPTKLQAFYAAYEFHTGRSYMPLPILPGTPDLTDLSVQAAARSQRRRVLLGQGIGDSFISGPLGDPSTPSTTKPVLGGY